MQLLLLLSITASFFQLGQGLVPTRRHESANSKAVRLARAAAIKEAFEFAWDGYYKYAFPHDELLPLNNSYSDSLNGWGGTAVDGLDTAIVMGNKTIVNEILKFIPTIDFSKSAGNESVSLFDATIRYLGGMLSSYDLLTGPMAHLVDDKTLVDALLLQAQHLANNVSFAFNTPSGVPDNNVYFNNRTQIMETTADLAQFGSLVLEWTHLADLTGNQTYAELAQKAESYYLKPRPKRDEPFPGLVGTYVNVTTGRFVDKFGGWIAGDDSAYEYLIKMYVYDSERFSFYKDRWVLAVESSMAHLASHPSSQPEYLWLNEFKGQRTINQSQELACFNGGNFLLGGSVLGRQDIIDFGLQLVKGCRNTWASTATGIAPAVWSWDTKSLPKNQTAFYEKHGFWIQNAEFDLNPETLESYWYAYWLTGDSLYQDWSWDAFKRINETCRAGSGFVAISDVNKPGGGKKINFQETFFFAEVLKYAYLAQAFDRVYDFNANGVNEFVFNTECHPLKVAGKPI